MQYFDILTIQNAIENLQNYSANWLLPAFVFAANDIGTDMLVDMSKKLGTDQFLDRYFHGRRLNLPAMPRGNNLLRPRLKGISWDRGKFAGDFVIRQDTKMWGNLFSSRGYREMRLEGLIEGEKAITKLTETFQPRFEAEVPETFRFEDFIIWLFAFEGIPDEVTDWSGLFDHLLNKELGLKEFKPPYHGRFKLAANQVVPWPKMLVTRPSNEEFLQHLAPKLFEYLSKPMQGDHSEKDGRVEIELSEDDPVYANVLAAVQAKESLAFLLAGPPGTGKTRYARQLAKKLTDNDYTRTLFLQFHPAIGYDDFIEGFRPIPSTENSGVKYDLAPRLFLNFAELATKDPERIFVAVIDELNRGDVARIFGEVLTYLEIDYRGVEFTLPYSGKPISLPKNLIVIATANPYDRSVTDLDDALLRRFWVIELEPDVTVLKSYLQGEEVEVSVINRTVQTFNILNGVFPNGFGHTNFLGIRSVEDLAAVWNGRVRLALRRTFLHDKATFEATVAEIEVLLKTKNDSEQV